MNDNASCPRVVLVQSLVGLATYIYVAIRIVWFDALVSSWIGEIRIFPRGRLSSARATSVTRRSRDRSDRSQIIVVRAGWNARQRGHAHPSHKGDGKETSTIVHVRTCTKSSQPSEANSESIRVKVTSLRQRSRSETADSSCSTVPTRSIW